MCCEVGMTSSVDAKGSLIDHNKLLRSAVLRTKLRVMFPHLGMDAMLRRGMDALRTNSQNLNETACAVPKGKVFVCEWSGGVVQRKHATPMGVTQ